MVKMTRESIEALTDSDVAAAKQRKIEARATRSGSSTMDFVLSQVDGKQRTLDSAKQYLLKIVDQQAK